MMELNRVLSQDLHAKKPGWAIEHDAVTPDGKPVLFAYILDIPRINRFQAALQLWGMSGTLVCFDFQKDALLRHFEGCASLQAISFEKFERRFFP